MDANKRLSMIVEQAKEKGWNNTDNWLFRKLQNEIAEFDDAIQLGKSPSEIATEYIDIIYMLDQILANHVPEDTDLEFVFIQKHTANQGNEKKTFDDKTQQVVRK